MTASDIIRRSGRRGFTLLEIIIVLGIIVLIASIALPSISALFSAGADAQAVALLDGQLSAARAGAVLDGRYWAVHVQMGTTDRENLKNVCFAAVMKLKFERGLATDGNASGLADDDSDKAWDTAGEGEWAGAIVEITSGDGSGKWGWVNDNGDNWLHLDGGWRGGEVGDPNPGADSAYRIYRFALADGYAPRRLPGTIAFGQVTDEIGETNSYVKNNGDYQDIDDTYLRSFTSLTIIFSPRGQVVKKLYNIDLDGFEIPFGTADNDPLFGGETKVWDVPDRERGVSAVTIFDYAKVNLLDPADRASYLDESGQFLPINVYSGRLFPRK